MRLIDADDIKLPKDLPYKDSVRRVLIQAPTVDAAPIVRGFWEQVHGLFTPGGDPLYRCPICKSEESEHLHGIECYRNRHYCPTCGAKLEYRP